MCYDLYLLLKEKCVYHTIKHLVKVRFKADHLVWVNENNTNLAVIATGNFVEALRSIKSKALTLPS